MPPTAEFEDVVDDLIEELRESLEGEASKLTPVNSELGERIHEYAAGDWHSRGTFDLAGMPQHVAISLCCMPPDQLARLAMAGPVICGRWAAGEKTGLVGVPLPRKDWATMPQLEAEAGDQVLVPVDETPSATRGQAFA
ncbi:hypothetical protein ACX3P0_07115 [Mesorhizobium sp. A556]